MSRPIIFISSTVHDFADLRSALKDYLEARGSKVYSSEFSDFPRSLADHSYRECLATIEKSHFFVLLIGKRSGGWFDQKRRISITRAEFEHALKLAEAERIRILTFVRREVLDHHHRLKELRRTLAADAALSDAQREAILYGPTEFMDKPRAISEFLDAVARNRETAAAAAGRGKAPIANWLVPFSTFSEVRQAIDPLVTGGFDVGKASGRKALETQLLVLLRGLLPTKRQCGPSFPYEEVRALTDKIEFGSDGRAAGVRVERMAYTQLVGLATMASEARAEVGPIQHLLSTDLLMDFDPSKSCFIETAEYDLLGQIVASCHALNATSDLSSKLLVPGTKKSGGVTLPEAILSHQLLRLTYWADLIAAIRSLARALRGGPLRVLPPLPLDPRRAFDEGGDRVSLEEVRLFVDAWCPAK